MILSSRNKILKDFSACLFFLIFSFEWQVFCISRLLRLNDLGRRAWAADAEFPRICIVPLDNGKFRANNCSYWDTRSQSTKECFSLLFDIMVELVMTEDSSRCFILNSWIVYVTFSRNENLMVSKPWAIRRCEKAFRHFFSSHFSLFQFSFLFYRLAEGRQEL